MKPRIFLSHSKKDKDFIVKLSHYLRLSRIDCWYDDWEIPPGESIRKKIFEDGLPSCDNGITDILGRLIIAGLVFRTPANMEYTNDEYGLTPLGIRIANHLASR